MITADETDIESKRGPHGLGDPNDRTLRKVEIEVLIPKKMRDKAKAENCFNEVKDFQECCKGSGILLIMKCRNENSKMKECLMNWYKNPEFKLKCTEEYLNERAEYRRTGKGSKGKEVF